MHMHKICEHPTLPLCTLYRYTAIANIRYQFFIDFFLAFHAQNIRCIQRAIKKRKKIFMNKSNTNKQKIIRILIFLRSIYKMKESFYTLWHLINVDCRSMLQIYVYIETKRTNKHNKKQFFSFCVS